MKKENFGIPASLLNVMIYAIALWACISDLSLIWVMLGLTVVAFALGFSGSVKKTLIQASALVLMFFAITVVLRFFGRLFGFVDELSIAYGKACDIMYKIVDIGVYVVFVTLGIMALVKKDLFVNPVHKAVDGFVPRPQYQQPQQYAGQPQQYAGQPQQPVGGPQLYAGQPQQYAGQPQQPAGGPQQFNGQPQQPAGAPQQFNGGPQQPK